MWMVACLTYREREREGCCVCIHTLFPCKIQCVYVWRIVSILQAEVSVYHRNALAGRDLSQRRRRRRRRRRRSKGGLGCVQSGCCRPYKPYLPYIPYLPYLPYPTYPRRRTVTAVTGRSMRVQLWGGEEGG